MSNAILCDRCGDKQKRRIPKIVRGAVEIDLCGPCMDMFDNKFMKNKAVLDRVTT